MRARTDGVLVGYTVQAFRERLGPTGVRDLIERKPVQIEDSPTADEPGAEEDGSGAGLGDGEQDPGDGLELAE